MIPIPLAEVAVVTGGTLTGVPEGDATSVLVDGPVVTDSREAGPGGLYVARVGEHADGHDFAADAVEAGCVAAVTTRPLEGLPCLVVEDTQDAFAAIARAVVDRSPHLAVVGVTGSSGKTSTKDLLGAVLGAVGPTVAPVGSYNSEVGVPLTVCRVEPDTRVLVVEMGARGAGHIAYLATMAPPRVGVVLNVGTAHVGEFGSREAIGRAKSELPAALPADGLAVLNADDPVVRAMAGATDARVVLVGEADDADVRATGVSLDAAGRPSCTVTTGGATARLSLGLVGRHHVGNALAVLAVALELGLSLDDAVDALAEARPVSRWRMEVTERPDGVTLVNDAYNANPDSMRAALEALERVGEGRRTWAVLGTMLELGDLSDALHAEVGAEAVARGVDELLVVGAVARPLADGARAVGGATRVRAVADAEAAEALLRDELRAGDVALFKSSRDAGLRLLGDRLASPEEQTT
ncbi:UDP-N-acetylmuramoyl-tripeptide--D-alanyl-D-alanine ligase [Phycicoccus sp. CSK15P-2]|uniref:UDP-N-acetylmuramoyl-tripeptide--D-alanyl-D- alanine ligase n=1 Tax=Phycicoccus sp. CSK15P-2 TaxID=2807627 RepID=UPI00195216BD|nr:UDP-N-acetylmuramoyl-tripeptide--D-alanyl-D-alanine ligase [Phycicoccus sp. CSK15P-2]MBM6404121.1 UDP-N-acetylmuramoyl-tripeptide--D-alanyl-D-alanine ligase [Phycicoccus sp. CSK15P-2]